MRKQIQMSGGGAKYLFDHLDDVRQQFRGKNRLGLFLDLDGTLAPIATTPAAVKLNPLTADTLKVLAADRGITLTIISGRSLSDLQRLVELPGIAYAGNHGLEISGCGMHYVHPEAAQRIPLIGAICKTLTARLRNIPGAFVEFKDLSGSIHYRLAAKSAILEIRNIVREVTDSFGGEVCLTEGKQVLEIRPALLWHKGSAARWILEKTDCSEDAAVYAGDDRTDEDAFMALPHSITIRVGTAPSLTTARYYVRTPDGVLSFLLCIEKVRTRPAAERIRFVSYRASGG